MIVNREKWLKFIEFAKNLKNVTINDVTTSDAIGVEVLVDGNKYHKFSVFKFDDNGIVQVMVFHPGLTSYATAFSTEIEELSELWGVFNKCLPLVDDSEVLDKFMGYKQ